MFADDVILLGAANKEQARVITKCLHEFCVMSGQKISTQKSIVYFLANTNEAVAIEVCNTLGIQRTEDFGLHLGVPAINGRVTNTTFQHVITRVDRRLAGWKAKCLSLAHLVAWNVVTKEKTKGGLGLRSMHQLNSAYLMKLGWRLQTVPNALWAKILREKYSRGRDINQLFGRKVACSNVWR